MRLIEGDDGHLPARAAHAPSLAVRRNPLRLKNGRIAVMAFENIVEPPRQGVVRGRVHPRLNPSPRMNGENSQIVDTVGLIRMVVGIENGVDMGDPRHQGLLSQVRRGVDQDAGGSVRTATARQHGAAGAPISGLARITVAPIAIAARHAAGRAATEDDDLQFARPAHSAGRGMRSNRAKKASVVRRSASSGVQPRISASFCSTRPT
ncbi:hypothetical protein D3C72_1647760 [compost metagenome]